MKTKTRTWKHNDLLTEDEEALLEEVKHVKKKQPSVLNKKKLTKSELDDLFIVNEGDEEDEDV